MTPTRIKRHRKRSHTTEGHMVLVPFIDMMTILVVFLLLHTSDVDILPSRQDITIPESVSDIKPRETLVVTVTRDNIYVAGKLIGRVTEAVSAQGGVFEPLKTALLAQSERVLGDSADRAAENREVTIMGDRNVPYSVLKKIMATCTSADFGKVSLAVLERERAKPAGTGA